MDHCINNGLLSLLFFLLFLSLGDKRLLGGKSFWGAPPAPVAESQLLECYRQLKSTQGGSCNKNDNCTQEDLNLAYEVRSQMS